MICIGNFFSLHASSLTQLRVELCKPSVHFKIKLIMPFFKWWLDSSTFCQNNFMFLLSVNYLGSHFLAIVIFIHFCVMFTMYPEKSVSQVNSNNDFFYISRFYKHFTLILNQRYISFILLFFHAKHFVLNGFPCKGLCLLFIIFFYCYDFLILSQYITFIFS